MKHLQDQRLASIAALIVLSAAAYVWIGLPRSQAASATKVILIMLENHSDPRRYPLTGCPTSPASQLPMGTGRIFRR